MIALATIIFTYLMFPFLLFFILLRSRYLALTLKGMDALSVKGKSVYYLIASIITTIIWSLVGFFVYKGYGAIFSPLNIPLVLDITLMLAFSLVLKSYGKFLFSNKANTLVLFQTLLSISSFILVTINMFFPELFFSHLELVVFFKLIFTMTDLLNVVSIILFWKLFSNAYVEVKLFRRLQKEKGKKINENSALMTYSSDRRMNNAIKEFLFSEKGIKNHVDPRYLQIFKSYGKAKQEKK